MGLTSDLTLQFLSSVNNDLFFAISFFVTGLGCEIECVGTTESTLILLVSVRVTCTIKLNITENFKIWILRFPGEKQVSNLRQLLL